MDIEVQGRVAGAQTVNQIYLDTARLTVIGREGPCQCQSDRTDMPSLLRSAWERLKGGLRSGSLGPVPA